MNIRKKAGGIAVVVTLLSALVATVSAPLAFASVNVASAGTVPVGQTSATAASFTLNENSVSCFGNAPNTYGASGGYIRIRILDSAGAATVHFVSSSVTAPGTLNASVSVQGATTNVLEVLFNGTAAHDDLNVEQAIAAAKISADAGAALGAIQAVLISGGPAGTTNQRACVLPTTTVTAGHLLMAETLGSNTIEIKDVGACDFQVTGGSNGPLVFGDGGPSGTTSIGAAPASTSGIQVVTVVPLSAPHPAGQVVVQTIATAACGLGNIALGSPGTVAVSPPVLAFVAGPGSPILAGQPFPTAVQVAIQKGGVTQTSGISATITLTIGANPSGGVLTCTGGTSVGTIAGVATFTGCSIDKSGAGYTMIATASNVVPAGTITPATSAPFTVGSLSSAVITLTTSCSPTPCPPDTSKSPAQANMKLPQSSSEGVTLVANFAGGGNRPITFEVSRDNVAFSTINSTTTDAAGSATFFYRPSDNRYYRVSFAGGGGLGAGMSPTVRIVVRSLIFLRPTGCTSSSPCDASAGSALTFTATARPNRPELPQQQVQFVVERRVGSTWTTFIARVVNVSKSTGDAQLSVSLSPAGSYRLRANLLPTPVNANSFPTEFQYYQSR